jgi:hypothetical protein
MATERDTTATSGVGWCPTCERKRGSYTDVTTGWRVCVVCTTAVTDECADPGPRIGSEGRPRCARPSGHTGQHQADESWRRVTWANADASAVPAAGVPTAARDRAELDEIDRLRRLHARPGMTAGEFVEYLPEHLTSVYWRSKIDECIRARGIDPDAEEGAVHVPAAARDHAIDVFDALIGDMACGLDVGGNDDSNLADYLIRLRRVRALLAGAPALDVDELTAALAAADLNWSAELGDPPSEPAYIQALARDTARLLAGAPTPDVTAAHDGAAPGPLHPQGTPEGHFQSSPRSAGNGADGTATPDVTAEDIARWRAMEQRARSALDTANHDVWTVVVDILGDQ